MANVKITELPQINFSSITNSDVIPIVDVNSNTTSKVLISDLKTFFSIVFTGGTVSGDTIFQNGLTANTISATTYLNLPQDIFVTGGSFSNGVITFTNNTGGTFSISGISSFDTFVTGGTYSNGVTTFTNNSGNTFSVVGYFTGYTDVVNTLTTGIGLSANTTSGNITIINTSPDQIVTISGGTGITTGGTYPNFTITNSAPDQTVILNDGNNISVVGTYPNFTINVTGLTDNDRYVTGFSYNNNTFTIGDNSGNTYDATFNDVTGLTVNGTLSATTISGGTLYGDGSNLNGVSSYYFYGTGTTQHFQGEGKTWATFQLIADRWNGIPLEVKTNVTVTDLKWYIDTPVVGDSVFGLYKINKNSNGEPSTLLWQTTVFSNNVPGLQIYTFPTPQLIVAGFYALVHHTSSNPSVKCTSWNQTISNMGLVPNLMFTENFYYTWIGSIPYSTYNGVLPSTWPGAPKFLANDTRNTLVGFTIQ